MSTQAERDARTQRVAERIGWVGPKVLSVDPDFDVREAAKAERARLREQRQRERATTGIRRTASGWAAIKSGRLVDEFSGPGCKAAAIQRAGTNAVVA